MSLGRLLTGFHFTTAYVVVAMLLFSFSGNGEDTPTAAEAAGPATTDVQKCPIPGTALEVAMVEIPAPNGNRSFWMSQHEISWDHYDVFVYELDKPVNKNVDAVTRPTRPYISADRGWGHAGFPALSVSHKGAVAFCQWLSASTGKSWRLPTIDEWRTACELGDIDQENMDEHAWLKSNSKRRTHQLATKRPDAIGLHDLHGNVAEWCRVEEDADEFVLVGSCYLDDKIECNRIREPVPQWNDTDPQIPKSIWWLADAPFAGFRVVCDELPEKISPQPNDSPGEKP